ncbi:MAG: amidase [Spirochaetes bacterium]|nr:amidase [Spirochaetota bacterium]
MSGFKEYERYDGLGLAELVKKKRVSPAELCEEAIARVERLNPALNAVIHKMYDIARKTAEGPLPPGPFRGVPFLLKDLTEAYAGVPLRNGSRAFENFIPDYDSELVRRYKKAGFITIGKTNTPELGLMAVTEPELFGPTRNPWNTDLTPGGSSGGSAAAVAAGMVPVASGGDGGGSIRIPASCCGLFGFKPTRARNPTGPCKGEGWQGAVVDHVITRSVRDSAAALDATQGMDTGSRCVTPPPARPFVKELSARPGKLRIAFSVDPLFGGGVHPECAEAVRKSAVLLEGLGHHMEEARPDLNHLALAKSYLTMYYGDVAADIDSYEELMGRRPRLRDFEATTWTLGLMGRATGAGELIRALREWDIAARTMARFHERYDIYITPTMAYPPVRVGELKAGLLERIGMNFVNTLRLGRLLKASGIVEMVALRSLAKSPFTLLANLTGQPAMSVPLHWTPEGVPVGTQFIARFGDEASLFRLAAQLERAAPWYDRRPLLAV